MLLPILIGLVLLFVLQKFGTYSFIISSFVGGFLSKKLIRGAIVGLVIWGIGIFLFNFSLTPRITSFFIKPSMSSIREPLVCLVSGLVGGLVYEVFR